MEQMLLFDVEEYSIVSYSASDFITFNTNREAFSIVSRWPNTWASNSLLLVGPGGSGKTHIAKIWQKKSNAIDISQSFCKDFYEGDLFNIMEQHNSFVMDTGPTDYCDPVMEKRMLGIFNIAHEVGVWLLMVARQSFITSIALPDLSSRMLGMQRAIIGNDYLDDSALKVILFKIFSDCQIDITPKGYSYISSRLKREFDSIRTFCDIATKYIAHHNCKLTNHHLVKIVDRYEEYYKNQDSNGE